MRDTIINVYKYANAHDNMGQGHSEWYLHLAARIIR